MKNIKGIFYPNIQNQSNIQFNKQFKFNFFFNFKAPKVGHSEESPRIPKKFRRH